MKPDRLATFSDGVIAIVITIMVLELEVPEGTTFGALRTTAPGLAAYALSFLYLAVHWSNHHHLIAATDRIDGTVLWANNAYLFGLSLVPFATAWAEHTGFAPIPMAVYGAVLFAAALLHRLLEWRIELCAQPGAPVRRALGHDVKGWVSVAAYLVGIAFAPFSPLLAGAVYLGIAVVWAVPDRRLAREIRKG